jgi:hypothetical protein
MKFKITTLVLVSSFLTILVSNCHFGWPTEGPNNTGSFFKNLEVGQEWRYVEWQKHYSEDRMFTGDTVSITVIAKNAASVTFFEKTANADSISFSDTTTIRFNREGATLRQQGEDFSRLFGFLRHHDGVLLLGEVDSNFVSINLDSSLFFVRDELGKPKFIGHTDTVELFSETSTELTVYYDQTPTYYDGHGHLALFSRENGIVAAIYFGGFSPVEQFGYELIKQ